jgi:hypothetical protein
LGRKRQRHICERCGREGRFPRYKKTWNPDYRESGCSKLYVDHYDPIVKKITRTCYVDNIVRKRILENLKNNRFNINELIYLCKLYSKEMTNRINRFNRLHLLNKIIRNNYYTKNKLKILLKLRGNMHKYGFVLLLLRKTLEFQSRNSLIEGNLARYCEQSIREIKDISAQVDRNLV